jgi:FtsP/CotA-like multicopper oxidase with cupredoxin domain
MYHSHHNAAKQVGMGLLGAFVIEPKRKRRIEQNVAVDYVMILNDGFHGYTLNGKEFPPPSRSWPSSGRRCASAS